MSPPPVGGQGQPDAGADADLATALGWAGELDDAERGPAVLEALAHWLTARCAEFDAAAALDSDLASSAGTWLVLSRAVAERVADGRSLEVLTRARRIADRLGHPDRAAAVYYDLAQGLVLAGRLDEALEVVESGLAQHDSWIYRPLLQLVEVQVARLQGRWEDGIAATDRLISGDSLYDERTLQNDSATAQQREIGVLHRRVRGMALGQRARLELELGRVDRAAAIAWEQLSLARSAQDPQLELDAQVALASCDFLGQDYQATLRAVDEIVASGLAQEGHAEVRWLRGMALGSIELQQADAEPRGAVLLEQALASGQLDQVAELDAEWMLAEIALGAGDAATARRWLDLARTRLAGWGQDRSRLGTRELRLLADEAELSCREGADEARLREIAAELEVGLETLLDSWSRVGVDAGGVGFLETEDRRALLGELVRVHARLDGERGLATAFEQVLRAQAMGSLARRGETAAGDLGQVRADLLGPGEGLLVYVVTEPTVHLLAIDAERIEHFELIGGGRLNPRCLALGADLQRRLPPGASPMAQGERLQGLTEASRSLGADLLPQAAWELVREWKAATVVGAEVLQGLQVEALGTPDGRLLGEALAVVVTPSLPLALEDARLRRSRSAAEEPREGAIDFALLAYLSPTDAVLELHPGLARVELDANRLLPLLAPYGEDACALLLDPPPTLDDLTRALDRAAVVQVLAHGVQDPFRERGSGLVLFGEGDELGLVWSEDLQQLPKQPRGLVLLTSCGTSVGPRRTGDDEPANLAGALLARGASGVLTTGSKLEYSLAQDLALEVHRHLAQGTSAAEALRAARATLGAGDRLRAFELAQVQLLGSPRSPLEGRPSRSPDPSWWLLVVTPAALLAAAVALALRRRTLGARTGADTGARA
ncbi:CHAT domain-containing protein [Engelhardtia mirabilis]